MTSMNDKTFIDTNIWLYALIESDENLEKHQKAKQCIANTENIIISTQVVNEVCVNLLRKGKKDMPYIAQFIAEFTTSYQTLAQITEDLIMASTIRANYHVSYWDSLMIASALRADCTVLFSEDMQDGLYVYKRLQIQNPLK
jgi:predicted nucleic acid-binding protein